MCRWGTRGTEDVGDLLSMCSCEGGSRLWSLRIQIPYAELDRSLEHRPGDHVFVITSRLVTQFSSIYYPVDKVLSASPGCSPMSMTPQHGFSSSLLPTKEIT